MDESEGMPMGVHHNAADARVAAVIAAERAWVEAIRHKDLAAMAVIMADDYIAIDDRGARVDKATDLADFARRDRFWEFAESDEYDVRLYGDCAVLVGRWRGRGVNAGTHFDYAARFVAVYVWRDARWQMVSSQSTPLPGMTAQGTIGQVGYT